MAGIYDSLAAPTGAANMRGAVDFTNSGQFTMYEKGHSLIAVLKTPLMMDAIKMKYSSGASKDDNLVNVINNFPKIIESEFKGLDGLDGMSADNMEISDNISTLNVLGAVNHPTNQEITMRFTEKAGRTLTKYCETYLRAIRDPRTRAKTYLGCADVNSTIATSKGLSAADYKIKPSFANEVFTFLYIVPNNTWQIVENAYLLTNCQITKAPFDALDNFDKGDISLAEIDLTLNTFVIANNRYVYEMANNFLTNFVERESYTEGKWNINSAELKYTEVESYKTNDTYSVSSTAGGAAAAATSTNNTGTTTSGA